MNLRIIIFILIPLILSSCSSRKEMIPFPSAGLLCEETAGCSQSTRPIEPSRDTATHRSPNHVETEHSNEMTTITFTCRDPKLRLTCGSRWVSISDRDGRILWKQRGPTLQIPMKKKMDVLIHLAKNQRPIFVSNLKPGEIRSVEIK